ncbi:MAG: TolC family protein [Thermoguttaceae bacterium]
MTVRFMSLLIVVVVVSQSFARGDSMTIDELRAWGSDQHPAVRKALSEWRAVRGDWIQAGLGENPNVGWVADTIGAGNSAGQQGVAIEKTFTPSATLSARQKVVVEQSNAARAACDTARRRAAADVTLLGYRIYFSQQRLTCHLRLIETIAQSLAANEKRLAALEISRAELLQEKIELNRRVTAEREETRRLEGLQQQLGLLIGREMRGVVIVPPSDVSTGRIMHDLGINEAAMLATSPEMQQRYAEIAAAQAELAKARAENCRNVTTSAAMLYDTETREGIVSLGVMIPLRTANRNQGAILASQHRVASAQHNADRARLSLQSRLAERLAEYEAAYSTWQFYTTSLLADAREMLKLMSISYTHGECSSLDVLIAQRTLAQVELEYLDAFERLATVRTELEYELLSGALNAE